MIDMNKETVLHTLRVHQNELQRRGVLHAAVFGSMARGEAKPDSDLDILVELDPHTPMDIFAYTNLKRFISDLFPLPTDVVNRAALKESLSQGSQNDAIYAF
jgi:predicted nucleotidyltransferase